MSSVIPRLVLASSFIVAGHLTRLCFRSPNPTPAAERLYSKDRLLNTRTGGNFAPQIREKACLILTALHVIATLWLPSLPHETTINTTFFTWSPYVVICLGIIATSAIVRLLAFSTLGKDFTFRLAAPSKLVTTGIYSHVQHPSYPPDFALSLANFALFANLDGAVGLVLQCSLPNSLDFLRVYCIEWKWMVLLLLAATYAGGITLRVRDEERMLEEKFGDEWRTWHRNTARFIPGVV